ncbi:hypothetical protein ACWDUD_27895, partial [Rhodococcus sp. NPDC003382]
MSPIRPATPLNSQVKVGVRIVMILVDTLPKVASAAPVNLCPVAADTPTTSGVPATASVNLVE